MDGSPILRPQYYVHPPDERGFTIDDQFYLGSIRILAKPVVIEGATSVDIYLSEDEVYYDYFDYTIYRGNGHHTIDAPLIRFRFSFRVAISSRGGTDQDAASS